MGICVGVLDSNAGRTISWSDGSGRGAPGGSQMCRLIVAWPRTAQRMICAAASLNGVMKGIDQALMEGGHPACTRRLPTLARQLHRGASAPLFASADKP
jgi:hypothetical protein